MKIIYFLILLFIFALGAVNISAQSKPLYLSGQQKQASFDKAGFTEHIPIEKLNDIYNFYGQLLPGINSSTNSPFKNPPVIARYDSVYYWELDVLTNVWATSPYSKEINYTYDANNNLKSYLKQNWDGAAWVNSRQYLYTYNANNKATISLGQTWKGNTWVNSSQILSTFYANNNLKSYQFQSWDGSDWVNYIQIFYTYNANNILTSYLYQKWNGSVWVDDFQVFYTLDANNNWTSLLLQLWNGSAWVDNSRGFYTYDANNNRIIYLSQIWNGSDWVNRSRTLYTNDANNNLTNYQNQFWDNNAWVRISETFQTFDVNNVQESYAYRDYDDDGITISYGDSSHYYFKIITGVKKMIATENLFRIYPNPTTGTFAVSSWSDGQQGSELIDKLEIYNNLGVKLYSTQTANQNAVFINQNLPAGMYIVKVSGGEKMSSQIIIIQ